jgi:hypothetical protein
MKLARLQRPKAACWLSYVENRTKANRNIMKQCSHEEEVTQGRGRVKEGN